MICICICHVICICFKPCNPHHQQRRQHKRANQGQHSEAACGDLPGLCLGVDQPSGPPIQSGAGRRLFGVGALRKHSHGYSGGGGHEGVGTHVHVGRVGEGAGVVGRNPVGLRGATRCGVPRTRSSRQKVEPLEVQQTAATQGTRPPTTTPLNATPRPQRQQQGVPIRRQVQILGGGDVQIQARRATTGRTEGGG